VGCTDYEGDVHAERRGKRRTRRAERPDARGFVAGLRERLLAEMLPCPTCKRVKVTLRDMGGRLGVSAATVMRWLSQGREPNARTIDAAVRYLSRRPR
jgi:hypothetical protein